MSETGRIEVPRPPERIHAARTLLVNVMEGNPNRGYWKDDPTIYTYEYIRADLVKETYE